MANARPLERSVTIRVALDSFEGGVNGSPILIVKGDLFASDDPAVLKWPNLFGPVPLRSTASRPRVEQATAAPGEQRGE